MRIVKDNMATLIEGPASDDYYDPEKIINNKLRHVE